MARIREAEGDLDGALHLLDEAQQVYVGDFSPNVRPVPASRARVLTAQGRTGDALAWAREQGLSAEDDPSYLREFERITLARVLLASYRAQRCEVSTMRANSCSDFCRQPTWGRGRAVSSRYWCCRRSPTTPVATFPVRWRERPWHGAQPRRGPPRRPDRRSPGLIDRPAPS